MLFSAKKKNQRKKKVGSFVSWIDAVILMLLSGSGVKIREEGRSQGWFFFSWVIAEGWSVFC